MKTILVLGAAALQLPLIKFIKSKGYRVIVVSIKGDYPGFSVADRCIYLDVRDSIGILSEIRNEKNIVGVITDQTDIAVPTVAFLAEQLGLPGNSFQCASTYSNKFLIRELCKQLHIPNPIYIRAIMLADIDLEECHMSFPVMIKPEDNQGSRGVYKCYNWKDIELYFEKSKSFSRTGYVIVEEFFEGTEVVVEGFVYNGQYLLWGIGERRYFDLKDKFIPSQTIFPACISENMRRELLFTEKKIHSTLNPSFGMIHSEYLINETTKEFRLVETALRGGGVYISSHLVPLYTGVNNYDLLLKCCLGEKVDIDDIKESFIPASSAYICFYLPEGEIKSITGISQLKTMAEVKKMDLDDISVGMRTQPLENKTMRLGPIIVGTTCRKETESVIDRITHLLSIQVLQSDNKIGRIHWL